MIPQMLRIRVLKTVWTPTTKVTKKKMKMKTKTMRAADYKTLGTMRRALG
jgi:hypothetical protein